jgi:DDE superfamily endonuclease
MWCVAELNDAYIAKMEDVLETYEKPCDPREPVVCLDEKPVTLHADVRPASPAQPGREARRDNEYERRGTANVFCAVEPKAGRHFTFPTPDRSAFEFAQVACHLAMQYPEADTIHLVMDNLNIHCRKSLTDAFGMKVGSEIWDRFTVHFTPTHGSWLNQAEIEIGIFSRQCLGTRRIPDLETLRTMFSSITMASSTTNPTDSSKAISDRLFRLKFNRYMTANVPTIENGRAIAGIIVAEPLRRNRKITRITTTSVATMVI